MTNGPLTLYFNPKGYHGSVGQSDSKLLDAARHRIQNLRAIKAVIMPAVLLAKFECWRFDYCQNRCELSAPETTT